MSTDIVFLFGAGASKGAAIGRHVLPELPPLMRELYDRLAVRFEAEWGPSSKRARYADRYRKDFELTFTEVDLGRPPDLLPGIPGTSGLTLLEAQRPLALYFASFMLDGSGEDLYSRLVKHLTQSRLIERTLFASLNYDCLCDEAALKLGLHLDYLLEEAAAALRPILEADRPRNGPPGQTIRMAKLHGSSNFLTGIDQQYRAIVASPSTSLEVEVTALAPIGLLSNLESRFAATHSREFFPVMTQISARKEDIVAPVQIQQIRNIWCESASNAALVVVIGVAPRQNDTHVWEALESARGDVRYIGADEHLIEWRRCNPHFQSLGLTFGEAFLPLLSHLDT